MSTIALLGGSFNPPHVAHQMICLWALSTGRAEAVWWVPTFAHPLGKALVGFDHRVRMCELALAEFPRETVRVSRVEAALGEPSRTLLTVERLRQQHPNHTFSLLIGADILGQTDEWYRFEDLKRLAELIVVGRSGHGGPVDSIELPPISSSQIRGLIAAGRDVSQVLPRRVLEYIREQGLYLRARAAAIPDFGR
jgi:nicotinate-nucleotide adenylyltransferase